MFSFDRSGVGVTGAGLAAGFWASASLQLIRRMASKAKANPVFFIAAVLLEVRAFRAFTHPDTATTRRVRILRLRITEQGFQSWRRATMGSSRVARQAGIQIAAPATTINKPQAAAMVPGS